MTLEGIAGTSVRFVQPWKQEPNLSTPEERVGAFTSVVQPQNAQDRSVTLPGIVVPERSTYLVGLLFRYFRSVSSLISVSLSFFVLLALSPVILSLYGLSLEFTGWLESHVFRSLIETEWAVTTVMVGSLYSIVVPSFVSFSVKVSDPVASPSKIKFVFEEPKEQSTFELLEGDMPAVNEQVGLKE